MDTAELYRVLLLAAAAPAEEPLLRAAAGHALAAAGHALAEQPPTNSVAGLLRDLSTRPDVPADVLVQLSCLRDPTLRRQVLMNPSLPQAVRLRAVSSERSPVVLCHLAQHSEDPEVLTLLAARKLAGAAAAKFAIGLLESAALPIPAAAVLIRTQQEKLAGYDQKNPDQASMVREAVRAALRSRPELACAVVSDLHDPELLAGAALAGLDEHGWSHIRSWATAALSGHPPTGPLTGGHLSALSQILHHESTPADLLRLVAEAILARRGTYSTWPKLTEQARKVLIGASATGPAELTQQLRDAASPDPEVLRRLVTGPVRAAEVARVVAMNPHADVDTVIRAVRRSDFDGPRLSALLTQLDDTVIQARVCLALHPTALDCVTASQRLAVLAAALRVVADEGPLRPYAGTMPWQRYVENLDKQLLMQLPWTLVRTLAHRFDQVAETLLTQLSATWAVPGASRLFDELDIGFPGSFDELVSTLAAASSSS